MFNLEAAVDFAILDGISPPPSAIDEVYLEFALIHIRKICYRFLALFPGVSLLGVYRFYLLGLDGRTSTCQSVRC